MKFTVLCMHVFFIHFCHTFCGITLKLLHACIIVRELLFLLLSVITLQTVDKINKRFCFVLFVCCCCFLFFFLFSDAPNPIPFFVYTTFALVASCTLSFDFCHTYTH